MARARQIGSRQADGFALLATWIMLLAITSVVLLVTDTAALNHKIAQYRQRHLQLTVSIDTALRVLTQRCCGRSVLLPASPVRITWQKNEQAVKPGITRISFCLRAQYQGQTRVVGQVLIRQQPPAVAAGCVVQRESWVLLNSLDACVKIMK